MSYEYLIVISSILTGIATLVMAGFTYAISKANKDQLKAQIFKERFEIYHDILNLIYKFLDKEWLSKEHYDEKIHTITNCYNTNLEKSRFIFGEDIYNYLSSIKKSIDEVALHKDRQLIITGEDKLF